MSYFFISKAVIPGNPYKNDNQISDVVLYNYLAFGSNTKIVYETLVTTNQVIIVGKTRTKEKKDISRLVKEKNKKNWLR